MALNVEKVLVAVSGDSDRTSAVVVMAGNVADAVSALRDGWRVWAVALEVNAANVLAAVSSLRLGVRVWTVAVLVNAGKEPRCLHQQGALADYWRCWSTPDTWRWLPLPSRLASAFGRLPRR